MYKAAWLNLMEWLKEREYEYEYTEVTDKMKELLRDEHTKVANYQKEMRERANEG